MLCLVLMNRLDANRMRFDPAQSGGHYESWFLRANHPTQKHAFWVRYTIFQPKGSDDAVGELWAIVFRDGEITAVKETMSFGECHVGEGALKLGFGAAVLDGEGAEGSARSNDRTIRWSLRMQGGEDPVLLLPAGLYGAPFPKAKALVPRPQVRFRGEVAVDGVAMPVDGWVGSQNHNWGVKHTDEYAWGQVVGFEGAPDAFLEVSTAKVHLGRLRTPWMTPLVFRFEGREHRLCALWRTVKNRGQYVCEDPKMLRWEFEAEDKNIRVRGTMRAPTTDFVALPYPNPPGGQKVCLNSKIARCDLEVRTRGFTRSLRSDRAAFEILTETPGSVKFVEFGPAYV